MVRIGVILNNNRPTIGFIAIFIINILMRGWYSTAHPIWGDEGFSLYFSQFSYSEIHQILLAGNNPPLFEWLLHLCRPLFQDHEIWLRWLSVICISASAALLYSIIYSERKKTAWIFALFMLCSNLLMNMSQFIRSYALVIFILTLILFLIERKHHYKLTFILFGTLCASLIYLHYVTILFIPCALWYARSKFSSRQWITSALLTFLLILPILYFFFLKLFDGSVHEMKENDLFDLHRLIRLSEQVFNGYSYFFFISLFPVLIHFRNKKTISHWSFWIGFIPFILLFALSLFFPVADRYLSLFLPFYLATGSFALIECIQSPRFIFRNLGYACLLIGFSYPFRWELRFPYNDQPHQTAEILKPHLKQSLIIISPQFITLPLIYHLDPLKFKETQKVQTFLQEHPQARGQEISRCGYDQILPQKVWSVNAFSEISSEIMDTSVIWVDSQIHEINENHQIDISLQNLGFVEYQTEKTDWKTTVHFYHRTEN